MCAHFYTSVLINGHDTLSTYYSFVFIPITSRSIIPRCDSVISPLRRHGLLGDFACALRPGGDRRPGKTQLPASSGYIALPDISCASRTVPCAERRRWNGFHALVPVWFTLTAYDCRLLYAGALSRLCPGARACTASPCCEFVIRFSTGLFIAASLRRIVR